MTKPHHQLGLHKRDGLTEEEKKNGENAVDCNHVIQHMGFCYLSLPSGAASMFCCRVQPQEYNINPSPVVMDEVYNKVSISNLGKLLFL